MRNWRSKVNVAEFVQNDELSFEARRDGIVGRLDSLKLKGSFRRIDREERNRFEDIVDTLRYSDDEEEFGGYWDDLYDWADDNGLWVEAYIQEKEEVTR